MLSSRTSSISSFSGSSFFVCIHRTRICGHLCTHLNASTAEERNRRELDDDCNRFLFVSSDDVRCERRAYLVFSPHLCAHSQPSPDRGSRTPDFVFDYYVATYSDYAVVNSHRNCFN